MDIQMYAAICQNFGHGSDGNDSGNGFSSSVAVIQDQTVSAVVNPVKLVITNYPEGQVEELEAINNPEKPEECSHFIEFSRELWMEREDFMEDAPKKYFRMERQEVICISIVSLEYFTALSIRLLKASFRYSSSA